MYIAGIGTPYWYEWEVGLLECLKMIKDATIKSITFQSVNFQSLDDVVVKYSDGSIVNIQVKHTDIENNLTYSDLSGNDMLSHWSSEWRRNKDDNDISAIRIITNRKLGINKSQNKCSLNHFLNNVLPIIKQNFEYISTDNTENEAIKWYKQTINLCNEEAWQFTKIIEFIEYPDLEGLDKMLDSMLADILGTDNKSVIKQCVDRLRSALETWVTSKRIQQEIPREELFRVLCDPSIIIPSFELYPEKPVFQSRKEYAVEFIKAVKESDKKIIFLQGNPGAGKTNFISYLAQLDDSIVDFRYYTYLPVNKELPLYCDDAGYYSGKNLWCSILSQLKLKFEELKILSDLNFPPIFDYLPIPKLREYVLSFLPIYASKMGRDCYLFIDGMDHAARAENKNISFLSQLPRPEEVGNGVKFIFVGQPTFDKYPSWIHDNNQIHYCCLPTLKMEDILLLLKHNNIDIEGIDPATFSNRITDVAGNNTLNIIFAIEELKNHPKPLDFDNAIGLLSERELNGNIDKYYNWIISHISEALDLYILEAIFAVAAKKIPVSDLELICNKARINIECILNQLNPIITKDKDGYYCYHNDVRLYFKKIITHNSNFKNIVNFIKDNILEHEEIEIYKYDVLFDLLIEAKDIYSLFALFTPEYIINSLRFKKPIDSLIQKIKKLISILPTNEELKYVSELSNIAITFSQYISCLTYYEKEKYYFEALMPQHLTKSEKYTLNASDNIIDIISDISYLIKSGESSRAKKLFDEYLFSLNIINILSYKTENQKDFLENVGIVYRHCCPDIIQEIEVETIGKNIYAKFVSGWLKESSNFLAPEEVKTTLKFKLYYHTNYLEFVQSMCNNNKTSNQSIEIISNSLLSHESVPFYIMVEICTAMILKTMDVTALQKRLKESIKDYNILPYEGSEKLLYFFKLFFCLYSIDVPLSFEETYQEALSVCYIKTSSRGYEPALRLLHIAQTVYDLFFGKSITDFHIGEIAYNLAYFTRDYGPGPSDDCNAYEIIPFLKNVFVHIFDNKNNQPYLHTLCDNIFQIFTGTNAIYINEYAYLYYIDNNRSSFLAIADFWCGYNGYVWDDSYDTIEKICLNVIDILNEFQEHELINEIENRLSLRLISYVDHKDYSLYGLLQCYNNIPDTENKLNEYGIKLLSISDYANKIGDNRMESTIDDTLFKTAISMNYRAVDALFELKNTPDDFVYWRKTLLRSIYDNILNLELSDDELCDLYRITNAWIKPNIEKHKKHDEFYHSSLDDYNNTIINLIKDTTIKNKLKSFGNCEPSDGIYSPDEEIDLEGQYPDVFISIKESGYTKTTEDIILSTFSDDSYNQHNMLDKIKDLINIDSLSQFASNCVIPFILKKSEYGYHSTGCEQLIMSYSKYFSENDWTLLIKDLLKKILSENYAYENYYIVCNDLEILALYYYLTHSPEKIDSLFIDKCNTHLLFITGCNTINAETYNLKYDDSITSISDFVNKQIGDIKLL